MKFSLLILTSAFFAAEASLLRSGSLRSRGATESSSNDWPSTNGRAAVDDLVPTDGDVAVLDANKGLHEHEILWELELQQKMTSRRAQDERMLLISSYWPTLNLWNYMVAVDMQYGPHYSTLMTLMTAAGKEHQLSSMTGVTLFAPQNTAFTKELQDFLLAPKNQDILVQTMDYHLVPSIVSYLTMNRDKEKTFNTSLGEKLKLKLTGDGLRINGSARAVSFNLVKESIIYRIDRILVPPTLKAALTENLVQPALTTNTPGGFEFPIYIPEIFGQDHVPSATPVPSDYPSMTPSVWTDPNSPASFVPSDSPSTLPSQVPTSRRFSTSIDVPSALLSDVPSALPSDVPSVLPSDFPSALPSDFPSTFPSDVPSPLSNDEPSALSSGSLSALPSDAPSAGPGGVSSVISNDVPSAVSTTSKPSSSTSFPAATTDLSTLDTILGSKLSHLDYDKENAKKLFNLFSGALLLYGQETNSGTDHLGQGRALTFFIPQGLESFDNQYMTNLLMNSAYNLHLLSLLAYHISNKELNAYNISQEKHVRMLAGGNIKPSMHGKKISIDSFANKSATIIDSTSEKGVGTAFVIDNVLVPQWMTFNVISYLETYDKVGSPKYSTFLSLVVAANMDEVLRTNDDITVFAPQNNAISQDLVDFLMVPEHQFHATNIVSYHVVPEIVNYLELAAQKDAMSTFGTFQGSNSIETSITNGSFYVNNDMVHAVGLASHAIIYRISALLIPEDIKRLLPDNLLTNSEAKGLPVNADLEMPIVIPSNRNKIVEILSNGSGQ